MEVVSWTGGGNYIAWLRVRSTDSASHRTSRAMCDWRVSLLDPLVCLEYIPCDLLMLSFLISQRCCAAQYRAQDSSSLGQASAVCGRDPMSG